MCGVAIEKITVDIATARVEITWLFDAQYARFSVVECLRRNLSSMVHVLDLLSYTPSMLTIRSVRADDVDNEEMSSNDNNDSYDGDVEMSQ
jgi:hypothetical protein